MSGPFDLGSHEIAEATGGRLVRGPAGVRFARVGIDSRTVRGGDLFIAIAGARFDGHDFVAQAIAGGAAGVVVGDTSRVPRDTRVPVFAVGDTLEALQRLATFVRRRSGARVVAITGSAGKTTTKEATATLLESRYRTIRNRGNLNNHIGLPLSLMDLTAGADVAVMEFGMNHAGEIRRLVQIAQPEIRVWTNVGTAHLEFFGTQDALGDAKAEVLEHAAADTLFVANADDPRVIGRAPGFAGRVLTFGIEQHADVRATSVEDGGFDGLRAVVRTPFGVVPLRSALAGRGHLLNLLAAIAVAVDLAVPLAEIAGRIPAMRPAAHRGEVLSLSGGITLVDDCYNSSPSALTHLLGIAGREPSGRRRVAFLGEMLELGQASEPLHREAGRVVAEAGIHVLVTVGGAPARVLGEAAMACGLAAASVTHVAASDEAAALAADLVRPGDLVLVKGSRGLRMERVVERLQAEFA